MKLSVETAPVLLLMFNRPDLTKRVFDAVRLARPQRLYLACDGPRDVHEENLVRECREILALVDWPCETFTLYRSHNLGCMRAVSEAISWFFEHETAGIILEDDVLPHPQFFEYLSHALIEFSETHWIGCVSGVGLIDQHDELGQVSCRSTSFPLIWGWATWRRVWQMYRVQLPMSAGTNVDPVLTGYRHSSGAFVENWRRIFDNLRTGAVNTWDYQLNYLFLKENLRCITPSVPLVDNIGFDARATHTTEIRPAWLKKPSIKNRFMFTYTLTEQDDAMDILVLDKIFRVNRWSRIKHYLKKLLFWSFND